MFIELTKAITAVVWELMSSKSTLILLPQPPVVPLSFDLLSADGNEGECNSWSWEGASWIHFQTVSCVILQGYNPEAFTWPKTSHFIFLLDNIINGIWVIMLEVIINRCLFKHFISVNLVVTLKLFILCIWNYMIHYDTTCSLKLLLPLWNRAGHYTTYLHS